MKNETEMMRRYWRGAQKTLMASPISQMRKLRPKATCSRLPSWGLGGYQTIKAGGGVGMKLTLSMVGLGGDLNFLYFPK